jgi:hypothetical protein
MHCARVVLVLGACSVLPQTAVTQTCTDAHYRWTEKTMESLASVTASRTTITTILTSWSVPDLTGQPQYKCAPRAGKELQTYSVIGWVRRVRTGEEDGDWHIELTSRSNSAIDSCIVAEIPPAELAASYAQARADLQGWASWNAQGDVAPPVRLRFIGAAFFDGEHRGGPTHRDRTDGAHGRCNASVRALWELHPVYWVRPP